MRGSRCENGLRSRHYYILSGSVLSVWTNVEQAVASRMQIIRLRTSDGKKIVGQYRLCNDVMLLLLLLLLLKTLKPRIALNGKPITELWSVTCHMGSQCYLPPDTSECAPPHHLTTTTTTTNSNSSFDFVRSATYSRVITA